MFTPVFKLFSLSVLTICMVWLLFGNVAIETLWWREALNSGHTILFFIISLIIYRKISYRRKEKQAANSWLANDYVNVFIICLLLNISIELLQVLVHREMSADDVYRGMLGTMAGLGLSAMIDMRDVGQKKIAPVLFLSSVIFLVVGTAPLMKLSVHYAERSNAFPVVMDFNSDWSESFVHYQDGTFPGVNIIEPEPYWLGHESLSFEVWSHNDRVVRLGFRVHDGAHNNEHDDRFNSVLMIRPGYNTFELPLEIIEEGPVERALDLSNVSGIILFSKKKKEWDQIEISKLTLK